MTQAIEFRPLRKGEYDLVNISLIGHDPVRVMSYDECQDEWDAARERVLARLQQLKWWQLRERMSINRCSAILMQRKGCSW